MNKFMRRRRGAKRRKSRAKSNHLTLPIIAACAVMLLVAGVMLSIRSLAFLPGLRVQQVRVVGVERLDEQRPRAIAGDLIGDPILFADMQRVRDRIEALPAVDQAMVARRMPDRIEVRVFERVAVAQRVQDDARLLIDADGFVFTSSLGRELESDALLPLLKGLTTEFGAARLNSVDMPALTALAVFEREVGEKLPGESIIDLSPIDRIVIIPGRSGHAIWLDREHPERNLENFTLWRDRVAQLAPGRPIDLRFPHQLVVAPDDRQEVR